MTRALVLALLLFLTACHETTFRANAPSWDHMPLTVQSMLDEPYVASVRESINFWNRELGHQVFVLVNFEPGLVPDVIITNGDASAGHLAVQNFTYVGGKLTSVIEMRVFGDPCEVMRILEHEEGHTLGLAHDAASAGRGGGSIMADYSDLGIDGDRDCYDISYVVTGADRRAILKRYFRKSP